jgi:glycosyltransferase involved in cell wall biosynthesis
LKIAQIAPLIESVPPKLYGGTERIVSYLTEELVARGHEVTLFASGDSCTGAELASCAEQALRLSPEVRDPIPHHIAMLERVGQRAHEFDILHFHIDILHYPLIRHFACRSLTTLHGRLDLADLKPVYALFPDLPLVSISDNQRLPLPDLNWISTVHHGLPRDLLPFSPFPHGDYFAFLGRISPEKRPDRAIEIAARTGLPLKIAAKIDRADLDYWHARIEPMIASCPNVEFVGEIGESGKAGFLGNARALLFPIDWPEPFGLVMVEAMACGTPVIAFRSGSVPEIIDDGQSGFVVDTVDQAIEACRNAATLGRSRVRECFERRFCVERMVDDYLALYSNLSEVQIPISYESGDLQGGGMRMH